MPLSHKTLQKVEEQITFQDLTGFRSLFTLIWKILTSLDYNKAKNDNLRFLVFQKNRNKFKNDLRAKIWPNNDFLSIFEKMALYVKTLTIFTHILT